MVVLLWHWEQLSETLLYKINIFLMVLDSTGYNKTLSGSDIVHDEFLEHSRIDVVNVVLSAEARHTESVVTEGSSEKEFVILEEGVVVLEMMVEIVTLLVL
jgi:hypothetical protein